MFDYDYSGNEGAAFDPETEFRSPIFDGEYETDDVYPVSGPATGVFDSDSTSVPFFPSARVKQEPASPVAAETRTEAETETELETEAAAESGATSPDSGSFRTDAYAQFPQDFTTPVSSSEQAFSTCFPPASNSGSSSLVVPCKRARSSASAHKLTSAPAAKSATPVTEPTNEDIEQLFHKSSAEVEEYARRLDEAGILTPELDSKIKHVCRQVKNRESAQLSRMRKRQYVTALSAALEKERNESASAKMAAEAAAAERDYEKKVSEIWRSYAESLRQALVMVNGGADVPQMPEIPVYIPPKISKPVQASQESFFSGPSGFGHLSRAKRH